MKENTIKKVYACILLLNLPLLIVWPLQAQDKKVKVLPVPTIGYAPETKAYIGAVSLFTLDFYKDSITRRSNAGLELTFTWNKQVVLESDWDYFFKEEKWFSSGLLHFSKYPDLYYGVGAETPDLNKVNYESKRLFAQISLLKNLGMKWFLGPEIKYLRIADLESEEDISNFPELENGEALGIGLSMLKDTRNNLLTPTKGVYLSLKTLQNFSERNYQQFELDLRYYKTWKGNFTWSNRLFNRFISHTPVFFDYSLLGGDQFVRGYYLGRFRDNHLSTWQTEIRFPVYKRFYMAAFGGFSNLYSKQHTLDLKQTKLNYGMGVRYLVDKTGNTFLRMDYAQGEDGNSGFYISFGESF